MRRGVRYDAETEVLECTGCGLRYLWPLPTADELAAYYAGEYRDEYTEPPVYERYKADLAESRARARRVRDLVDHRSNVLEIGSGSGAFLDALRPHVASITGVEPDDAARAWIESSLSVRVVKDIESAGKARFDLAVMFHVLEHVPDPVGLLAQVRDRLTAGGRIGVEVPNLDDALVSAYKVPAYQPFYYQKAHLTYFTADTLRDAFARADLDPEITGLQRYDLSNHLHWMLTGEPGGMGRYAELLGPAVDAAYASALIEGGRSDTLWAVSRARA